MLRNDPNTPLGEGFLTIVQRNDPSNESLAAYMARLPHWSGPRRQLPRLIKQAVLHCEHGRPGAGCGADLGIDVLDMVLDGSS